MEWLSQTYERYNKFLFGILFTVFAAAVIFKLGLIGAVLLLIAPFGLAFLFFYFRSPKIGLYFTLILGFTVAALDRYLPYGIPFGLGIDVLLFFTFVVLLFKHWKKLDLSLSYNDVVLLMVIWMFYVFLELFNPLASSFLAWFYSMRGVALYQLLCFGLAFSLFKHKKDWLRFLNIWLGFSVLAAFWAMKQKFIGLDGYEQGFLDSGAAETHVLFGKLRHFSFYYDAGTFGSAMGHATIMAGILFLGPYSLRRRILYLLVALICFYGLIISGTRGALAVPGIGGILFLIMTKNVRLLIAGGLAILGFFIFLKFTNIGASSYDIQRLRSALDASDPSLQVRLINRENLSNYLQDKPFGTGLGTAGYWGKRFSPNTWMADFETDGLYTRIRAETGRVGHTLFVWMWIYILVRGVIIVWRMEDRRYRYYAMGVLAGYAGILVANYGNSVMSQFPNNLVTFIGLAFVFNMKHWDKQGRLKLPSEKKWQLIK